MIDWNPVLVNITAPGGVGAVMIAGFFAWRKIKNLSPTEEESEEAVAVSTAPKEVKHSDTMTHDLVAMMAHMQSDQKKERERNEERDRVLEQLQREFHRVSYANGVRKVWIDDVIGNWPVHRLREQAPPPPNVEPPKGIYS